MYTVTLEDAPRMLWREFKKSRKLKRWESLPLLKLIPRGRSLFVCDNCHFANIFGTLCLWCGHSCQPRASFSSEVRRRASAPQLLNDLQKNQLRKVDGSCFMISALPNYPKEPPEGRRKRHRDAAVISVQLLGKDDTNENADLYMQALAKSNPSLLDKPRVIPSIYIGPQVEDTPLSFQDFSASTLHPRTLRRKQRQSVLRQRSSCSLRRKAIAGSNMQKRPQCNLSDNTQLVRKPSHARISMHIAASAPSIPACHDVPLGHPDRPLYTAIRKNMSHPTTPMSIPSRIPGYPSPPIADVSNRGARSLDFPTSPIMESLLMENSQYPMSFSPRPCDGFSLSGEIEMRMALARTQSSDDGGVSAFRFRRRLDEASLKRSEVTDTLKLKVKKIRKSLKGLMFAYKDADSSSRTS